MPFSDLRAAGNLQHIAAGRVNVTDKNLRSVPRDEHAFSHDVFVADEYPVIGDIPEFIDRAIGLDGYIHRPGIEIQHGSFLEHPDPAVFKQYVVRSETNLHSFCPLFFCNLGKNCQ